MVRARAKFNDYLDKHMPLFSPYKGITEIRKMMYCTEEEAERIYREWRKKFVTEIKYPVDITTKKNTILEYSPKKRRTPEEIAKEERDVEKLLKQNKKYKDIARILNIPRNTVTARVYAIKTKEYSQKEITLGLIKKLRELDKEYSTIEVCKKLEIPYSQYLKIKKMGKGR